MGSHEDAIRGVTDPKAIIGARLRRLRESRGLLLKQVGEAIAVHLSTISRVETGTVKAKPRDVRKLLDLYGVTCPHQRDYVLSLLDKDYRPGWWHGYGLPLWLETRLALEAEAEQIRTYQMQTVPTWLQTPDYARAARRMAHYPLQEQARTRIELGVEITLRRREQLLRSGTLLWAVVDEDALLRPVGGTQVHANQLDALINACKEPNVCVQIARRDSSAADGYLPRTGPFTLLRSSAVQERPDVVYLHQLLEDVPLGASGEVDAYLEVHSLLCVAAYPPDDTVDQLTEMRDHVRRTN